MAPNALEYLTAGVSKTGRREANEDSAAWASFGGDSFVHAFAMVCDGMGGHNAGEVASVTAVELIESRVHDLAASEDVPLPEGLPKLTTILENWVTAANRAIYEKSLANVDQHGMGTTLALALVVKPSRLLVVNVGDSKVFLVRGHGVRQLSTDHTALAEQRRALGQDGVAPEDDAGNPFAHALTRSLGQDASVEGDLRTDVDLEEGDLVIVTSDGVTDVLESERFLSVVEECQSLTAVAEEIYRLAFESGSRDNITVAVMSYGPPTHLGTARTKAAPVEPEDADKTVSLKVKDEKKRVAVKSGGTALAASQKTAVAQAPAQTGRRWLYLGLGISIPLALLGGFLAIYLGRPAPIPPTPQPALHPTPRPVFTVTRPATSSQPSPQLEASKNARPLQVEPTAVPVVVPSPTPRERRAAEPAASSIQAPAPMGNIPAVSISTPPTKMEPDVLSTLPTKPPPPRGDVAPPEATTSRPEPVTLGSWDRVEIESMRVLVTADKIEFRIQLDHPVARPEGTGNRLKFRRLAVASRGNKDLFVEQSVDKLESFFVTCRDFEKGSVTCSRPTKGTGLSEAQTLTSADTIEIVGTLGGRTLRFTPRVERQ